MCMASQPAPMAQEMLPQVPRAEDTTGDGDGKVLLRAGGGGMKGAGGQQCVLGDRGWGAKVRWEESGM